MPSQYRIMFGATLAMLLALVCYAATRSDADGDRTATHAVTVGANGDDTASIPDFDGDGTIGFGDFVIFAGVFGARQGDEKYEATHDLNGDGEIGFSDFVIFAQNFGKDVPSPVVAIPDANLRAAIETALGIPRGEPITQAEMATLDSLAASDAEITDLTGLESAVNLTYLSLNDNDITDISALSELTILEQLWLSNNRIEDISALAKLTNLTELWLWNNQIEDIVALSGLTNLTRLSLGRNNITDIAALSRLTNLTMLILKSNHISDLAPLAANKGLGRGVTVDVTDNPLNAASESTHIPALQTRGVSVSFAPSPAVVIPDANLRAAIKKALGKASGAPITQADMATLTYLSAGNAGISNLSGLESAVNLSRLELFANSITDVSVLTGLANLEKLVLWGNRIRDISPLSGLTNLVELSLGQNNVTDISPLARLTNLTSLSVGDANITDLSVLSNLPDLTHLRLIATNMRDVTPLSGLTNLTSLVLSHNQISDISPLAGLTNLTELNFYENRIEDISVLSGLSKLTQLGLSLNNVSDISALSGLFNLTELWLNDNNITNISPLAGLINLTWLNLAFNTIADISALSGLSKLMELNLAGNRITDTSALSGLTNLRNLDLRGNPHETLPKGDFDIEFVFLDNFTESQKQVLQYVARRWMAVIRDDLPDYVFSRGWSGQCGKQTYEIPAGDRIDDLRIYISTFQGGSALGYGGPSLLREESHLPVVGCMAFDLSHANLLITGLHEIGHVLGFASEVWNEYGFYQNPPNGDTHFNGPLATAAFDNAGGRDYKSAKVPLQTDESHWRGGVFGDELMTPTGTGALSVITVQSLADLGYGVDVAQADAYTLPSAAAGKTAAKVATSRPSVSVPGVDLTRATISPSRDADLYGQGRMADGRSSIFPDRHWTGRQESAEWVWTGYTELSDVHVKAYPGLSDVPESKLRCGGGQMNEPIYVVDKKGRVVRTVAR